MTLEDILQFLFGKNPGGMTFPEETEGRMAVQQEERDAARAQAELAASQASGAATGPGAKRKLSQEEQSLQDLMNTPRGQKFGR